MRVLVVLEINSDIEPLIGVDIQCCPHLAPTAGETMPLIEKIREMRPQVIITGAPLPMAVIAQWHAALGDEPALCVRVNDDAAGEDTPFTIQGEIMVSVISAGDDAVFRALAAAERHLLVEDIAAPSLESTWARVDNAQPYVIVHIRRADQDGPEVLLIGAGVVNLVTASLLVRHGYRVTLLEKSPDPRLAKDWSVYGCSRGGGNARMFTLTEADDYHDKDPIADRVTNTLFDQAPSKLGWNILSGTGGSEENRWIQEFRSVPPWLARGYNRDIFDLNRRSGRLWDEWIKSDPGTFEVVHLRHDILRLYEDPTHLAAAVMRQEGVGALLKRYRPEEIREEFPALSEADPGAYSGGVLVRGFTLSVHDFMARILDELERSGVHLVFGERVETALRDRNNRVAGVLTARQEFYRADHYVVSPGVYGENILANTESARQIHGVLGCWITVPNLEPRLENSLKVARRGHVAEDANVTVGRDAHGEEVLLFGSGYGYTGLNPENIDRVELKGLHAAVADTVRRLFPRAYAAAGGAEILQSDAQFCVRPWTPSNLGLFEVQSAATGAFVVTGGHNTGGFAQAPVIAEAVLDALAGRSHPMHTLYHPRRLRRLLGTSACDSTLSGSRTLGQSVADENT